MTINIYNINETLIGELDNCIEGETPVYNPNLFKTKNCIVYNTLEMSRDFGVLYNEADLNNFLKVIFNVESVYHTNTYNIVLIIKKDSEIDYRRSFNCSAVVTKGFLVKTIDELSLENIFDQNYQRFPKSKLLYRVMEKKKLD